MKTPEQIINEIKNFIFSSKLFRFPNSEKTILDLLTELENTLSPSEVVVNEETIMSIIENPIEFTEPTEEDIKSFNESVASFLEIESVEEPVVEEQVATKRGAKKK